ncbi:MAG TPA: DUF3084 domain-containing protein [Chthonomonadaceae bacterium]|nr:DUF3084 domain-containing protein [Chthonomonadaceae bacterium]
MVWTLLSMLALVLTGGFISYYGDLQGRKWGKKRVSWFGLRPKHTAILITSLSGAVIALLSVAAVLVVAPEVRAVVLQGERAINENRVIHERLRREDEQHQISIKLASVKLDEKNRDLEEKTRELAHTEAEISKLTGAVHDLEDTNVKLGGKNMDLQRQQAALQRSVAEKLKQVAQQDKLITRETSINSDLARQNTNYIRENGDLQHEREKLLATNATLTASNDKLKTENVKLASDNVALAKDLDRKNDQYKAADSAYNNSLDEYNKEKEKFDSLKSANVTLELEKDRLEQQRDELASMLKGSSQQFVREYLSLRQARYNLRAETELARRTLDAGLSPSAAREQVMALLNDASDYAKRRGAAAGDNGRTVAIVSKRVVTPSSTQMTDEGASIDALVESVSGSKTPVVIVARAINNSSANEQVLIELTPYKSSTVFQPEATVASRTVDARQPIEKLVESVILFLRADVRSAAIKAGTITQISPETGEEEVGAIDTADLVTLLDRIRKVGGLVQVAAIANEQITSGDLLTFGQTRGGANPRNLRFDVKRAAVKPQHVAEAVTN